jgi:SpoVK/Ycf46/Vps4 family AAA+-type ATPase
MTGAKVQDAVPTAEQVKALIRAHAEADDERFYAVAMQVAAQEARNGHGVFAQQLRALIDKAKERGGRPARVERGPGRPVPMVQPRGELAGLLGASYPKTRLSDMVLEDTVRERLERVIVEQHQRERLAMFALRPIHKLLLVGPSGVGKTMSAAALAGELDLPLFSLRLDGLITKYMGETAAKLRLVFDAMQETRAVYLFDEFDALGGDRASNNDVGETRRILNSFLVLLEQDESEGLVICATNHPRLLDPALFRRFDSVIDYALPPPGAAVEVMRARLAFMDTSAVDWPDAVRAASGLSHSEIARACERAAKDAILDHRTVISSATLIAALQERHGARS